MSQQRANVNQQCRKLVQFYIGACILFALISGASGVANAWFNRQTIDQLRGEKAAADANLAKADAARVDAEKKLAESAASTKAITESLRIVLEAKEADALRTSAAPEVQNNIHILKESVSKLQE